MNSLRKNLREYWGYDTFRPLQREAMQSILDRRDSVVVLPTGGGKSLCFQAPALSTEGLVVVVSPLISLMKDQVDALRECGIEAACLNSSLSQEDQQDVLREARTGGLKLLYVAPERLLTARFMAFMRSVRLAYFVIDEAHCISMWGHDFRREYRLMCRLKDEFPNVPIHAYTATATEHVRDDIVRELALNDAEMLVGSFDRPNLRYHFQRRRSLEDQLPEVLAGHHGESGVIYCIRRKDVEALCAYLCDEGHNALPYHAGLNEYTRHKHQERFIQEEADIIVATVAFGMGIDKSNVRYVIHASLPKSIEHYQQESGRAGRDGLAAECYLFHHEEDYGLWRYILDQQDTAAREVGVEKLDAMYRFATGNACRHRAILTYFGEEYDKPSCEACDVCGVGEGMPEIEATDLSDPTDQSDRCDQPPAEPVPVALEPAAPPTLPVVPPLPVLDPEDGLFEYLRRVRRQEGTERALRPYMVFSDVSLWDMVHKRPTTDDVFRTVTGVGRKKARTYGRVFCTAIREYCQDHAMATDTGPDVAAMEAERPAAVPKKKAKEYAFDLFGEGHDVEYVVMQTRRPEKSIWKYLLAYVQDTDRTDPSPWVYEGDYERVAEAAEAVGLQRLKSIQQYLDDEVPIEHIRIAVACLRNREYAGG